MRVSRDVGWEHPYNLSQHTTAPLRVHAECHLDAPTEEVWARIADHEHLGEFVPLVGRVIVERPSGEPGPGFERVCSLTGMGKLRERFLVWDPPVGYVYSGAGRLVPIRDHVGAFHVRPLGPTSSVLTWQQHFRTRRNPLGLIFPWVMRQIMRRALVNLQRQFGGGAVVVRKVR